MIAITRPLNVRPVELLELLVAHEAAGATVHGDEDPRIAGDLHHHHGQADLRLLHEVDGSQQLVRMAVHVERAAAQRAEHVGDHVEGRDDGRAPGAREAQRGHLLSVHGVGREVGAHGVGHRQQALEGLAQRRRPEERTADVQQVVGVGHDSRAAGSAPARSPARLSAMRGKILREGEAVGVAQELVVLLGLHVLALDELERRVVGQVAARPAQLLDAQGFVAVGGEQPLVGTKSQPNSTVASLMAA